MTSSSPLVSQLLLYSGFQKWLGSWFHVPVPRSEFEVGGEFSSEAAELSPSDGIIYSFGLHSDVALQWYPAIA